MTQICGNSWVQFSYDYGIPTALSIAAHPLVTARTLMMLGYEYEPPVRCKSIFGGERYALPNVFRYLGYLREDVGLLGLFSTGLTASIIGGNIRSVACDAYLKRNVVNYHNKKSVIDTENGPKVFAEETSKLMIARCLGIVASYPFQVVMVRQIAQIVGKETIYSNLINALIDINFEEGLPGLFSGLLPRLLGEVITVWLVASFAYVVNNYVFPEGADPELKQHTPMVASMFVSTVTHRLTVTSTVMAVSGAGLAVSIPFKNSISCYNYLQSRNAFIRGASLFFRYANGPL